MSKIYSCPNCGSTDVFCGYEKIPNQPFVLIYAGCKSCGLKRQSITR